MNEPLTVENFTHLVECYHQIGHNRRRYFMKCHLLGTTKSGKAKLQVYGRLYWGGEEAKIRYVEPCSVRPREQFNIPAQSTAG